MRKPFAILAGVMILLVMVAPPAHASEQPPLEAKQLPSAVALDTLETRRIADDCATVRPRLPELARAAAKEGATSVACIKPTEPGTPRARKADPTLLFEPFPLWCTDVPGSWVYTLETREMICAVRDLTLDVINVNTGAIIGQIYFDEYAFEYTSSTIPTFAYQIMIDMYGGWGSIGGTLAQGTATCTGACTVNSSDFLPQAVTTTNQVEGEAFFRSTATTRGSVGTATATWSYYFVNPSWVAPSTPVTVTPPVTRCDHNLPGNNTVAGCIIRDIPPAMIYSVSSAYEELAWHILAAQDSGLPGSHPSYGLSHPAPLNRLVNAAQQTSNYNRSCPSSYPRPAGLSCDEYPFQSSQQGAATGGGGPGRTFGGCQVPLPAGTGPSGYSACMIDNTQNSEGGSALGSFYIDQRIFNADPFYVWITP
ncbi:hypothetical protein AB0J27_05230 [Micromonospora chokoriensis]